MIDTPDYFKSQGYGKLYCDEYRLEVTFELFLISNLQVIYCKSENLNSFNISPFFDKEWTIDGYTNENIKFFSTQLRMTNLNDSYIELFPTYKVIIGEYFDYTADKIIYPITNLFDVNLELNYEDYFISIKSEKNSIKKQITKYWKVPQLSSEIVLEKKNELIENYTLVINNIIRLISLATGYHLSISIQKFYYGNKSYTLLLNNNSSPNHIYNIIPERELVSFLTTALPIIKTWDIEKFKDFKTTLEYLNSTNDGFLDDRILKLVQCYEIIGNNWVKSKYNFPNEIIDMKNRLRNVVKDWKNQFPKFDENGFWSNRIYQSLDWEKAVFILENVITSQNLDTSKINVDFKKLVRLRNEVAHRGRFGKENAINDLVNGQFGLRLFLLKTLEYKGKIIDYRNFEYPKEIDITEFNKIASA